MDDPKTTIFLTGAGGFVAGALLKRLAHDKRFQPVALSRGGAPPATPAPAVIFHAGWPSEPSDRGWAAFVDHSLRLRRIAAERGWRFVGVGSGVEAFADDARLKDPYAAYARRKLELRRALEDAGPEGLSWLRLHFLFGPGERPSRIVPSAIAAAKRGAAFLCGSLDRRRRWLGVDDQSAYLADFLAAPVEGDWDIAGRTDISFREFFGLVEQATGRPLRLKEGETTPDGGIGMIGPARIAAVVPEGAGSPDALLEALRRYADALESKH